MRETIIGSVRAYVVPVICSSGHVSLVSPIPKVCSLSSNPSPGVRIIVSFKYLYGDVLALEPLLRSEPLLGSCLTLSLF